MGLSGVDSSLVDSLSIDASGVDSSLIWVVYQCVHQR